MYVEGEIGKEIVVPKKSILAFDPGESTGWAFRTVDGGLMGGVSKLSHKEVAFLIDNLYPDIVVLESFKLYPGKAASLAWNSFYPCEVIGVIKFMCALKDIPYVEQAPSVKKYFGGFRPEYDTIKNGTEHVKDAYQHLRYFERNGLKKF